MSNWNSMALEQSKVKMNQRNILKNVYMWMTLALAITGIVAYAVGSNTRLVLSLFGESALGVFIIPIVTIGLVFLLAGMIHKMSPIVAISLFIVYAILIGVSLSVIFLIYELGSIFSAFFGTAAMFAVMSIYGYVTKRDLSGWGHFLRMAVIGLFIANIVTWVIGFFTTGQVVPRWLDIIISSIGVIVFTLLTAYDTQNIKKMSEQLGDKIGEADYIRLSIQGALSLYMNFINIFVYLLRLFGSRN